MRFTLFRQSGRCAGVRALLGCTLLGCALAVQAAEVAPLFSLRHWTRQDGLPNNEITALCLDRTGYLWIGLPTGVTRFDGTRFLNYDYAPAGNLTASGFAALAADPAGDGIWAAPYAGGLVRFRQGKFERQTLPENHSDQRVARLFVSADRALWVAFEGGEVMRLLDGRHEIFGVKDGLGPRRSTQLATDGAGRVWLANGPLLLRYEKGALLPVPLEGVTENMRIASARQDGPWVLTRGWLHKVVDGNVGLKVAVNGSFNARSVQALMEDTEGAVWTATRSRGVRRLTLPDQKSDLVVDSPEDVGVLLQDGSGNIWVGSNGGGLVRARTGAVQLFDKTRGLPESHTLGVCEDNAGVIWIANRDGGVAFINEQGRVHALTAPRGRDTFSARSVAPAGPSGVLATTSYGLLRADKTGFLAPDAVGVPRQPPSDHGEMRVTLMARNGDLWVVLDPGRLGRLRDGVWTTFTEKDGLEPDPDMAQALAEDLQGRIWVGTEKSALLSFDGVRFTRAAVAFPAGVGSLHALHFDKYGVGWIGTAGAGLVRLGAPGGRTLDELHGLPSNNLTQVISDDHGDLWGGSPQGIFHVRREELDQFFDGKTNSVDAAVVSADDGRGEITGVASHQPSAWKSHDGLLWFATRQGVVAIDPRRGQVPDTPLVVKVDAVRAGDASWPGEAEVRVPALTRALELDYSVLCLSAPDRVRARIRLLGYDDDWMPADGHGLARYSRLTPGEYTFLVEAHLAGAPRTAAQTSILIVVPPAWWQTWWFRIGAAGLVLLLGALGVRTWSHRRLRARLAELEHASALERERARIAQNIHDELGSGLTRISLLTQTEEIADGRAQLDRIYGTVSDLTQAMDEIVWAVNPKNDNLEGLANYVVEFAQGFLTDAGVRCRVGLPAFFPPDPLTTQCRHHLFMACKEALNNVVKHAHATEVSLQIDVADGRIQIVIADNGRGRDATPVSSRIGHGLTNMQARLAALGGTCEIVHADGTTVTFSAPLFTDPVQPRMDTNRHE